MPVNSLHPQHEHWCEDWQTCRDSYNGQRAVKKAGVRYLPRLSGQTDAEYTAYKNRALFYSITSKSVSALVGMATARPPVLTYGKAMTPYFKDNSGTQFFEAFSSIVGEILLMGRFGLLVDRSTTNGMPSLHGYKTESILNWKETRDGTPYLVVLKECVQNPEEGDEFCGVDRDQYRVLRLASRNSVLTNEQLREGLLSDFANLPVVNKIGSDDFYTVSIYDHNLQHVSTVVPTNSGRPMNIIPFYCGNPMGITMEPFKPPMLDIADINISHYRTSADLEHGRHFTGLPTPVVTGVSEGTVLKIGSTTAWVLPDVGAKAMYLEFSGQGLTSLENAMKEKQTQMATLSSRLMDNSANGSEAADAIRLRYMSESASLSSIVRTAEAMLNMCYKTIAAMIESDPDEVGITLEKEFHNVRMSASEVVKLTESYLDGGMSVETYVYNLRRGDQLSPERTDEDEIKAIEEIAKKKAQEAERERASKQPAQPQPSNQPEN